MSEHDPRPAENIDRYLDGLLPADEAQALDRAAQGDSALAGEVERQELIDSALTRLYVSPSPEALARVEATIRNVPASTPSKVANWRRSRPLQLAAGLAIGVLAIWRLWSFLNPPAVEGPYGPMVWRSMETVYRDVAKDGFKPGWPGGEREFARVFQRRFKQPLQLTRSDPSIVPLGIGFCNTITPATACVITKVSTSGDATAPKRTTDAGVLVFVDLADVDPAPAMPTDGDLHVFQRRLGRLALYEVTPLHKPLVLDLFYQPSSGTP